MVIFRRVLQELPVPIEALIDREVVAVCESELVHHVQVLGWRQVHRRRLDEAHLEAEQLLSVWTQARVLHVAKRAELATGKDQRKARHLALTGDLRRMRKVLKSFEHGVDVQERLARPKLEELGVVAARSAPSGLRFREPKVEAVIQEDRIAKLPARRSALAAGEKRKPVFPDCLGRHAPVLGILRVVLRSLRRMGCGGLLRGRLAARTGALSGQLRGA
mmetsp:Transcript_48495/g.134840  ORF Transcript_48495/g.134840 Transcript_48495/m.134840 type:complete len:219 (-) Transcript_48495:1260-1916(-)